MKKFYISFMLFAFTAFSGGNAIYGNNLKLENINYDQEQLTLTFDISWENAWYVNDAFRDAVWVFAKYKASNGSNWNHLDWRGAIFSGGDFTYYNEAVGFRIDHVNTATDQFDVTSTTVTVQNLTILSPIGGVEVLNPSIQLFGLEMVYIPEGNFYVGDGASEGRFTGRGDAKSPLLVDANTDDLYVAANDTFSVATEPVLTNYPTGWSEFYMMKYEFTQGIYRDFLNTCTRNQQQYLTIHNIDNASEYEPFALMEPLSGISFGPNLTSADLNAIKGPDTLDLGPLIYALDLNNNDVINEADDGAPKACTNLMPSMLIALLDWAALRPMSEMEYEKACRGFEYPVENEFAWGSSNYTVISNDFINDLVLNSGTSSEASPVSGAGLCNWNEIPLRVGFAANETTDRLSSSSSYFGVQNLSDNVMEFTIPTDSYLFDNVNELSDGDWTDLISEMEEEDVLYRGGGIISAIALPVSGRPIGEYKLKLGVSVDEVSIANRITLGGRGVR